MRRGLPALGVILAVLAGFPAGRPMAAEPIILEVAAAEVCRAVAGLSPVEPARRFPADIGRVYCLSRIGNIARRTQVQHIWYAGTQERFRISMDVKPPSWRVYSTSRIRPADVGPWRIEIRDREGNVLKTVFFEIAP
jgi:hypothetical protein